MNKLLGFAMVGSALLVSACASNATMQVAPAINTYAVNEDEIPGRWAVVVNTDNIPETYESGEFTCSGWTYNVDAEAPFEESVLSTLDSVFEEVTPADRGVRPEAAQQRGLSGTVIVNVDRLMGDLSWRQGFWSARAVGQATIRMGLEVRDADGERIAGFSEGAQRSSNDTAGGCDAGSQALAEAISSTTQDLMEEVAERLLDNESIRAASQGAASSR